MSTLKFSTSGMQLVFEMERETLESRQRAAAEKERRKGLEDQKRRQLKDALLRQMAAKMKATKAPGKGKV